MDNTEKTYNVQNLYFCINDRNEVGIYRRFEYYNRKIKTLFNKNYYDSGLIFEGLDNDNCAVIETHYDDIPTVRNLGIGKRISDARCYYTVNCMIKNYISFNNLCLKMIDEGLMSKYTCEQVSQSQLLKVIKYAYKYFDMYSVEKAKQKKLTKSKDE